MGGCDRHYLTSRGYPPGVSAPLTKRAGWRIDNKIKKNKENVGAKGKIE